LGVWEGVNQRWGGVQWPLHSLLRARGRGGVRGRKVDLEGGR